MPKAWEASLLVEDRLKDDDYRSWPPAQPLVQSGDSSYWQSLPEFFVDSVIKSGASLWPVIPASNNNILSTSRFATLGSVLVAQNDVDQITLRALANAGQRVVQPPEYIMQILGSTREAKHALLTCDVVHHNLLVSSAFYLLRLFYIEFVICRVIYLTSSCLMWQSAR